MKVNEQAQQSGRILAFPPPSDWDVKPLRYLFESVGGATPSKNNPEYWEGRIPWVSPKDMKSEVIEDSEDHISNSALAESRLALLPPGTVLVVVRGMILLHTIPVAITAVEVTINQDMKGLFPRKGVIPEYLALVLRSVSPILFSTIEESGHGTRCLRLDLWRNILVGVPPQHVQHQIVEFVGERSAMIDALIAKKRRIVDLLHERRQALISEAVTKGLNPDLPMKDSGVEWRGQVPAHWKGKKLRHLFHQSKRLNHPDLTVLSVYREYGVIDKSTRDDNHNRTPEDLTKYQLVNAGDLVINKMKAWQGSLGVSELRGITSPDYIVYENRNFEYRRFLHHLLRIPVMADVYRSISNGIRPSQWRLEPELFESLVIWLPPKSEQVAICEHIDSELKKIESLYERLDLLEILLVEYRQALISSAVTGQIDVCQEVE